MTNTNNLPVIHINITMPDLSAVRSLAIQEYVQMAPHVTIRKHELDEDERRAFAWLKAVVTHLNKQGALTPAWLKSQGLDIPKAAL